MIRRKILSLAWPAVCEMMLYMLLDFVDVAFVGRLGAQSLAAVGLGAQIYFSILFIFCALSAGATSLIARAVGAKDPEKAGKTAGHALSLAVLIGIAVTVSLYLFTDVVVGLFRFEASVQQLAAVYIKTTGSVAAFGMVLFISNGIFRGAGLTKIPFYIAALIKAGRCPISSYSLSSVSCISLLISCRSIKLSCWWLHEWLKTRCPS
jgi:MATE family multidrug resistance protein